MGKMYKDDDVCEHGVSMNAVISGDRYCQKCIDEVEVEIANYSTLKHLGLFVWYIFNFHFLFGLAHLKWAQERICKSGDYNPKNGKYYRKGYLKNKEE